MKKIIFKTKGLYQEASETRERVHKGSFSRRFSRRFTRACAAIFASALWRRLLFSLSLALTCTLLWSCALPMHSSASFLSFLALFVCALLGSCSNTFSINLDSPFDAFVVNKSAAIGGIGQKNQTYTNNGSNSFKSAPASSACF